VRLPARVGVTVTLWPVAFGSPWVNAQWYVNAKPSGSVPDPENVTGCPVLTVVPVGGAVMVGWVGAVLMQ
jgi:hypothetical protein